MTLIDDQFDLINEWLQSDNNCNRFGLLCAEALRLQNLFENLVKADLEHHSQDHYSTLLNIQHRMHPRISQLVSACFYDNKLTTSETAIQRFASDTNPFRSSIKGRFTAPITVIDMPYQQKELGLKSVESYPRYTNQREIDAVLNCLRTLHASSDDTNKKPSLAVLSPYARQVEAIQQSITSSEALVKHLDQFRPLGREGSFCSTVDGFQGNEADAVVVSLVRNNHHGSISRALGFLTDPRRMNVLLSRAKWRLILVGSLEFLKQTLEPQLISDAEPELLFWRTFFKFLEEGRTEGFVEIISAEKIEVHNA